MDFSRNNTSFIIEEWNTSNIPGLVGAILYTVAAAFLCEALHVFIKVQELKLHCRKHKVPVHLGLSTCHVVLTGLRISLVLAVLSGNMWVWISLGVGAGTGYFFLRPCLNSATSGVSEDDDVNGHGRARLKTVRKLGHYSVYKSAQQICRAQEEKRDDYYNLTTENNNNNNTNNRFDTDRQTQPLLHTAPQCAEVPTLKEERSSTTFLPSAQPTCTIQNMSNEERWDYIRETFQKLSRSHLYAGLERRRMQDQSYLPCQSPRNTSHAHWESSFDVSAVDFNDLLNEESYRAQEIAQGS
uniref:Copper transporter n=1 Tax=Magallana gigas TaxID=29159 RepID=A0A8W8MDZ2_MAGGI|nr:uncharacterized protein LOC105324360 [Crassostrea gigas]